MFNQEPLAIVTGGSRGIGAACVQALHRDGFNVAFTYVSLPEAAQALEVPHHVKAYKLDIRHVDAVAQTFKDMINDFGVRPQVVVVNAGMNLPYLPIGQFSHDSFRQIMETNLFGAFNVLHEAAHAVLDGGCIIGMTTSLVRHAAAGTGAYTASKAGVEALIRSMAKELAVRNIRVNAVAPGSVDTELFHSGKTDEAKARSAALSPFNRIGTTAEVAEVVSFLASTKASWVHGQVIQPNGGMI